jgi:hypothetical protein
MFGVLEGLTPKGRQTKALMDLYGELRKNLEIFHVMDQRQFIDMEFRLQEWQKAGSADWAKAFDKVHVYGCLLEEFNAFYRGFKEYEKWYAADMDNKTRENAEKLHTQRSELDKKLKGLYPVICRAGEQVEYKLIEMGLLKQ